MEVNNVEEVRKLLRFEDKDDYYFIQVIQRRKDNLGMSCDARGIKSYYITSLSMYDSVIPEIMKLSHILNARVYIHINPRNYRCTVPKLISSLSEMIYEHSLQNSHILFDRISSRYPKTGIRKSILWVVDVDDLSLKDNLSEVIDVINNKCSPNGEKFITELPTVSGSHLITRPFNTYEFKKYYPNTDEVELSKAEKPTLLYYKPNEDNYMYYPLIQELGGLKVSIMYKRYDPQEFTKSYIEEKYGVVIPSNQLRDYYTENWKTHKRPKEYIPIILINGLDEVICINRKDKKYYSFNKSNSKELLESNGLIINKI